MKIRGKQLALIGVLTMMGSAGAHGSPPAPSLRQTEDADRADHANHAQADQTRPKAGADRSGKTRHGKASYYGRQFYGKKMANGAHLEPDSNAAASKTLPIGTTAKVTNEETGKSAVVVVQDRGPYVPGRIIDVTPKTADKLELKEDGVAPVEVTPLKLPPPGADAKDKAPAEKK